MYRQVVDKGRFNINTEKFQNSRVDITFVGQRFRRFVSEMNERIFGNNFLTLFQEDRASKAFFGNLVGSKISQQQSLGR